MSETVLVQVKTSETQRDRWDTYADESERIDDRSDLVRKAVEAYITPDEETGVDKKEIEQIIQQQQQTIEYLQEIRQETEDIEDKIVGKTEQEVIGTGTTKRALEGFFDKEDE